MCVRECVCVVRGLRLAPFLFFLIMSFLVAHGEGRKEGRKPMGKRKYIIFLFAFILISRALAQIPVRIVAAKMLHI